MTKKQDKFKVYIDDNFHYMNEGSRQFDGEYDTYEEAEDRCKEIVEKSIMEFYKPGITESELSQGYFVYGEEPFVIPTPAGKCFPTTHDYRMSVAKSFSCRCRYNKRLFSIDKVTL